MSHRVPWWLVTCLLSSPVAAQTGDSLPPWVEVDVAARTVQLRLETGAGDSGAALINGHYRGEVQLVIPLHWTVRWSWRNADSVRSHSLVLMVEREKLPTEGGRPAFSNAMSRSVTAGLRPGQTDLTTFVAEEAGWYWLLCGVPDHALQGEWIGLRVDPGATMAAVRSKR